MSEPEQKDERFKVWSQIFTDIQSQQRRGRRCSMNGASSPNRSAWAGQTRSISIRRALSITEAIYIKK